MYNFLTKNGTLVAFGLGLLVVAIFYISAFSGLEAFNAVPEKEQPLSDEGDIFLAGIMATVVMVVIAFAAWLIFGVIEAISNPKAALKGIIGIGLLVGIFFIIYSISPAGAPGTSLANTMETFNITDGVSKFVSGAIGTSLVLLGIALLSFVVTSLMRFLR